MYLFRSHFIIALSSLTQLNIDFLEATTTVLKGTFFLLLSRTADQRTDAFITLRQSFTVATYDLRIASATVSLDGLVFMHRCFHTITSLSFTGNHSPTPSDKGKSEDSFTTIDCFTSSTITVESATAVVQADLYLSLSSISTVDGSDVHLVTATNCNDPIPEATRVLLVKKDACSSLGGLSATTDYSNLERIGFGDGSITTQTELTLQSSNRPFCST